MCIPISNFPVSVSAFSSKTLQNAKVAPLENFSLQNDQSHLEGKLLMNIDDNSGFWSSKCVLEHFGDFGSPEPSMNDSVYHYKSRVGKIGEFLAPKVLFGSTSGTWGPAEAGWLRLRLRQRHG